MVQGSGDVPDDAGVNLIGAGEFPLQHCVQLWSNNTRWVPDPTERIHHRVRLLVVGFRGPEQSG